MPDARYDDMDEEERAELCDAVAALYRKSKHLVSKITEQNATRGAMGQEPMSVAEVEAYINNAVHAVVVEHACHGPLGITTKLDVIKGACHARKLATAAKRKAMVAAGGGGGGPVVGGAALRFPWGDEEDRLLTEGVYEFIDFPNIWEQIQVKYWDVAFARARRSAVDLKDRVRGGAGARGGGGS
jgi:hypothetical protein